MMTKSSCEINEFAFPYISERQMACERLLFNTAEDILLAMQDAGVSQLDLAKKLGKSTSHVSQLLNGERNMTLKTLSDISYSLNAEVRVVILREGRDVSHPIVPERKKYKTNFSSTSHGDNTVIRLTITSVDMDFVQNATK